MMVFVPPLVSACFSGTGIKGLARERMERMERMCGWRMRRSNG